MNFIKKGNKYSYDSRSIDDFRKKKGTVLLHWLPVTKVINVELLDSDGKVKNGHGEPALSALNIGTLVQFVRVGFARLEKKSKDRLCFIYSHK